MAWSATTTFTTGQVVTAAQMNVISGDLDALNTRPNNSSSVATSETRANAAYGDLATSGPAVTVTTGTFAIVFLAAKVSNNTNAGDSRMSVAVSGATTTAAADSNSLELNPATAASNSAKFGIMVPLTLTAGSNTFTAKYRSGGADTATFADRTLIVLPQF